MKTTVEIPDELYEKAESMAAREHVAVADVIARGLRWALADASEAAKGRVPFPLVRSARPGALTVEQVQAAEEAAAQQEDLGRAGAV